MNGGEGVDDTTGAGVRAITIYCDTGFPADAEEVLVREVKEHTLVRSEQTHRSNLTAAPIDPRATAAEVIFGQPSLDTIEAAPALRWVQLTSAGYARYDTDEARQLLAERDVRLTTSSSVYAIPCAEQALAAMLMFARWLDRPLRDPAVMHHWPSAEHRRGMRLLTGARVVLLGYGAIARHLTELLGPFSVELAVLRRRPSTADAVNTVGLEELPEALRVADHVVNTLPGNAGTVRLMNAERLQLLPSGAHFYNLGRGSTVDAAALLRQLEAGRLAGAYLDVTEPEPLPADDPLWRHPRCVISPHVAGGWRGEQRALVTHFAANLERYLGDEPLMDRVC